MSANDASAIGYTPLTGPKRNLLIATVMLGTLMQVLDMTIANVALPHMQAALGATQQDIGWVLTSYIVAAGVFLPITGWVADRIGQRRLFLLSVACFVIASVLCGLATNLGEMVVFRLFQGMAGACLAPLAQTILLDNSDASKRNSVMAIFGMGIMIGPVLGPVLGGWLTDRFDWRWVFFVNVPIGLLCFVGLIFLLPERARPARPFDLSGFVLLALGIGMLQLMLDRGENLDWFSSWEILIELGVSVSAFWMFAIHLTTAENPLYHTDMLRDRNLVLGATFMLLIGMILMGSAVLLPLMVQQLMGFPVIQAGELMASRGVGTVIAMGLVGRFGSKLDPRLSIAIGLILIAMTMNQMAGWSLDVDQRSIAWNGLIQGMGIGAIFVPISTVSFATIAPQYRTDGAGLVSLTRSIGGSVAISVLAALLARNTQINHADLAAYISPYNYGLPAAAVSLANSSAISVASIESEILRQSAMIAFLNDFRLIAFLTVIMIPTVLLIRRPAKGQNQDDSTMHMVLE
ncbi:MAG: DHA2 family efflux MFS transporter permease subunit [Sphingobium sp.]